jgi:hypothetical protein
MGDHTCKLGDPPMVTINTAWAYMTIASLVRVKYFVTLNMFESGDVAGQHQFVYIFHL